MSRLNKQYWTDKDRWFNENCCLNIVPALLQVWLIFSLLPQCSIILSLGTSYHFRLWVQGKMIGNIKDYAKTVSKLSDHDDSSIDRLNYVLTTSVLIGFSLLLFAKNYVGEPMQCWTPNQFNGGWEMYAEQYCFIENTYFVPMNDSNLPSADTREGREMIYYQWVPFILVIQALFFCIPRAFWIIFPTYSGLTIADMITAARSNGQKLESADKTLEQVALTNWKADQQKDQKGSSIFNCYLVMKLLILINVILQFFLLNFFLNTAYIFWGWGIFWDMVNGRHWQESGHFPRVSFCDINVRELGNVHHWSLQCVLMVNMFNEKIFIFLWFWFAFLLVATAIDFVIWVWRRFNKLSKIGFISDLLNQEGIDYSDQKARELYQHVLRDDGVLFLRLLDSNSGRLDSEELMRKIYNISIGKTSNLNTPTDEQ